MDSSPKSIGFSMLANFCKGSHLFIFFLIDTCLFFLIIFTFECFGALLSGYLSQFYWMFGTFSIFFNITLKGGFVGIDLYYFFLMTAYNRKKRNRTKV